VRSLDISKVLDRLAVILCPPGVLAGALTAAAACAQGGEPPPPPARALDPQVAPQGNLPRVRLSRAFAPLVFNRPVWLTHAGDGSERLFVLEQNGRIRVFSSTGPAASAGVFLDIEHKVFRGHNEEGLLALAFHPRFADNGYFYVYYSASKPRRGVLSRFSVSPDDAERADPSTEAPVLEVGQPYGNHNGATVLFGPDGYLYLSLGDGGLANDPLRAGQDLSTMLGKILRIDVDRQEPGKPYAVPDDNPFVGRPGALPEIWAYGLRNVWRMSFDRETGDLWAGDVGQNAIEEVDLIVRGGNYGWSLREGTRPLHQGEPPDPMIDPVIEYPQRQGRETLGLSVTGGYVYRGRRNPRLTGAYVYGDYVTGRIWALRHEAGRVTAHREVYRPQAGGVFIASFGEDAAGELYVCAFDAIDGRDGGTGRIYLIEEDAR
jgi:glucose/arabinose dehydrogenase